MSDDTEGLAARLQRLEDIDEIRRLFQDYRHSLDGKDFRAYADLFAQDGELIAGPDESFGAKGREEIFALVDGMLGKELADKTGEDLHVTVNDRIDIDGDRATATGTWVYVRCTGDIPNVSNVGSYIDTLTRENGKWKLLRREVIRDIPKT